MVVWSAASSVAPAGELSVLHCGLCVVRLLTRGRVVIRAIQSAGVRSSVESRRASVTGRDYATVGSAARGWRSDPPPERRTHVHVHMHMHMHMRMIRASGQPWVVRTLLALALVTG